MREISDSDGVGSYEGMFCKVIYFYSVAERFSGILFFVVKGGFELYSKTHYSKVSFIMVL